MPYSYIDYEFNVQEEEFTALLKKAKGKFSITTLVTQLVVSYISIPGSLNRCCEEKIE